MTSKQMLEFALVELNKREAPSLLLEDYNYFINKAINQYINKMYNAYDTNQQKTDDLRVLKATTILPAVKSLDYSTTANLFSAIYKVTLPNDYLHVLNCVVEYKINKSYKCYNAGNLWHQGASRLTADMFSQIINNYYLRPSYKQPYYYIHNVNVTNNDPTSDNVSRVIKVNLVNYAQEWDTLRSYSKDDYIRIWDSVNYKFDFWKCLTLNKGKTPTTNPTYWEVKTLSARTTFKAGASYTVDQEIYVFQGDVPKSVVKIYKCLSAHTSESVIDYSKWTVIDPKESDLTNVSIVEKHQEERYGNSHEVNMEIRYGKDDTLFELQKVYVDYLKTPQFIRLIQEQVDEVEDNSQIMEFPDYVCQEILNELIRLLMENASDPRLQSHIPINQSIATPGQQQQAPRK